MLNFITFNTIISLINLFLGISIKIKTEKNMQKSNMNIKCFKYSIEHYEHHNIHTLYFSFSYNDNIFEVMFKSLFPFINAFTLLCFAKTTFNYNKQYNLSVDIYNLYMGITHLEKIEEYDNDSEFFDQCSDLIADDTLEYKEEILEKLKILYNHITNYESINDLSEEDKKSREILLSNIKESISKFKNIVKELSTLHNDKKYKFEELEQFNQSLDELSLQIKLKNSITCSTT